MEVVTVGESVVVRIAFTDEAGQPMAATGAVINVQPPFGAASQKTPEPDGGVGRFKATVEANEPGTWRAFGECAGPAHAVTPSVRFLAAPRPF